MYEGRSLWRIVAILSLKLPSRMFLEAEIDLQRFHRHRRIGFHPFGIVAESAECAQTLEVFQSADRAFIPSGVKIPNALETKRHGGPKGQTSTAPPVSHRWNQCEINVRYVAFVNPNAFAQRLELANELRFVVHGHDDFC